MTDIVSLSIPHALIQEAKRLGINCSKVAREAIQTQIEIDRQRQIEEQTGIVQG